MQILTERRPRNRHPEPARPPADPSWPGLPPAGPRPSVNHVSSAEVCRRFGLRPFSVQAVVHCAPVRRRWFAGRPLVNVIEFGAGLGAMPMARDTRPRNEKTPPYAANVRGGLIRGPEAVVRPGARQRTLCFQGESSPMDNLHPAPPGDNARADGSRVPYQASLLSAAGRGGLRT